MGKRGLHNWFKLTENYSSNWDKLRKWLKRPKVIVQPAKEMWKKNVYIYQWRDIRLLPSTLNSPGVVYTSTLCPNFTVDVIFYIYILLMIKRSEGFSNFWEFTGPSKYSQAEMWTQLVEPILAEPRAWATSPHGSHQSMCQSWGKDWGLPLCEPSFSSNLRKTRCCKALSVEAQSEYFTHRMSEGRQRGLLCRAFLTRTDFRSWEEKPTFKQFLFPFPSRCSLTPIFRFHLTSITSFHFYLALQNSVTYCWVILSL